MSDRHKKYYADNKEKEKARHKVWSQKNAEHLREYNRKRYALNPNNKKRSSQKFRDLNPGYSSLSSRRWAANNKERIKALDHAAKARRRGATGFFTLEHVSYIRKMQRGKCAYCRCSLTKTNETIDHIVPIILGGTNLPHNLQLLCSTCNKSKGPKDPIQHIQSLGFLL